MSLEDQDLLRQFIPEARDLLDQAGQGLLALERNPLGDETVLNDVFRAVHTLKGTSGLFAVAPLTRVVHAAEEMLGGFRAGSAALPHDAADVLLSSFDLVSLWIDALDTDEALPQDAEAASDAIVARILGGKWGKDGGIAEQEGRVRATAACEWIDALGAADLAQCRPEGDAAGLVAIEYRPDAHCFFRGEDPALLMRQISGLRLLRLEPARPWQSPETLDPFECNLVLRAVAATDLAEAEHVFRYVSEQVTLSELAPGWPTAPVPAPHNAPISDAAMEAFRTVITAQRMMLLAASDTSAALAGRIAAAGAVLGNAMQSIGASAAFVADLARDATKAKAEGAAAPLVAFIDRLLAAHAGSGASTADVAIALPSRSDQAIRSAPAKAAGPATLRVEQSRIDDLMTLVGQLVVAKNSLAYLARKAESGEWDKRSSKRAGNPNDVARALARDIRDQQAQFNRIAEDMQAAVMAVRMSPLSQVFQRFPRLVRDQARKLGKEIELVLEGEETEVDKNMVEALADPLIHMVRNSLDHGFEPPEERRAAGKASHGILRLTAEQENDSVIVRLIDDGRGISPDIVRRKAVEKELMPAEEAAALSDEQAVQLVFAAGFSTADTVSDLSGRGVGMDAVRGAVEKLGGRVFLSSRLGEGTVVTLTLPLTLAITRIITIEAGGGRLFGIPMGLVVETVRIPRASIHRIKGREAFLLRDTVVPLLRLNHVLDLPSGAPRDEDAVLVVKLGSERLGVVVDAFREGMEVMVKPMDGPLAGLRGFAGTTLLGDGRVLLILDLRELV